MNNDLQMLALDDAHAAHMEVITELARLDRDVEDDARRLHGYFLDVFNAAQSGTQGVVAGLQQLAQTLTRNGESGCTFHNLRTIYYRWKRAGRDPRACVNRVKAKKGGTMLPLEFLEYFGDLCCENQRKCAPAHNKLLRQWRTGVSIPGYGTWQEWWTARGLILAPDTPCPPELPPGWHYSTMMKHAPELVHLALARQGIHAGRQVLPYIIGTRAGDEDHEALKAMEWVAFDDVETDFLVLVPGIERPCKLRALVCKDVATDCYLKYVLRPAVLRDDGKEDGLKLPDMKRLVANLLTTFGVPATYTSNWIVERGTATLPPGDCAALAELSCGLIKVHPTSMISGRVLIGGFSDKAVGNSWGKAWLESGFSKLHNELGAVKGQKGRLYQAQPMELEQRKKQALQLVRAGGKLTLAMRQALKLPFPTLQEASDEIGHAMLRINQTEDHDCEGFDKIVLWRLAAGDAWRTADFYLTLDEATRERGQWHQRTETRLERWTKLTRGLKFRTMPDSLIPRWYEVHKPVTVEHNKICFELNGRDYTFFDPRSPLLSNGAKYLGYFDPIKPEWLYLTNGDRAYRGKLPRVKQVRRGDAEALAAATKQTRAFLGQKLAELNSAAHGRNEQALADMEHNAQVLGDAQQAVAVVRNEQGGVLPDTELLQTLAAESKARDTAHRQAKQAKKVNVLELMRQQAGSGKVSA